MCIPDPSLARPARLAPMARLVRLGGLGVFGALGLAACGADTPPYDSSLPLADGVWVGESAPDEEGAFGRSTVTVSGGKITGSQYVTVQANGSMKGEDYGKDSSGEIANRSAYRAAQKAVSAFDVYARDLIEVGVPADVDVVSGATIAHGQFLEAATEALTESQMAAERGRTGPAGGGSESGGPADG